MNLEIYDIINMNLGVFVFFVVFVLVVVFCYKCDVFMVGVGIFNKGRDKGIISEVYKCIV